MEQVKQGESVVSTGPLSMFTADGMNLASSPHVHWWRADQYGDVTGPFRIRVIHTDANYSNPNVTLEVRPESGGVVSVGLDQKTVRAQLWSSEAAACAAAMTTIQNLCAEALKKRAHRIAQAQRRDGGAA